VTAYGGPVVAYQTSSPRARGRAPTRAAPSPCPRSYPALQWQLRAARRAVHRAAAAGGWLRERAALTRYAHVPLADLGGDPSLAIADALYARCLRAAGHVLWVRDPALPDPGETRRGYGCGAGGCDRDADGRG
jgi:hypothetical protein